MSYSNILSRVWNTPLWILEDKLTILNSKVFIHLLANAEAIDRSVHAASKEEVKPSNDVIVIPVSGTLIQKNGYGASGMTSYEWIDRSIDQAISDGYNNIILAVNSPGGEVFGNDSLSRKIANYVATGINIVAFVDGQACSAAYAIAAACKTIYTTRASILASIGTIITMADITKADAKDGVKYTILRSKSKKALYNPHEKITDAVIVKQTAMLEEFDSQFNDLVTTVRPKVTSKLIADLEGDTVMAQEAITLGLADEIVTGLDDVLDKFDTSAEEETTDLPEETSNTLNKTKEFNMADNTVTTTIPSDLPTALQTIASLQSQLTASQNSTTIAVQAAVLDERNRCKQIADAAAAFHLPLTNASDSIMKGHDLSIVAELFTAHATTAALQSQIAGGADGALQATAANTQGLDKKVDLTAIIKANLGLGTTGMEQSNSPATLPSQNTFAGKAGVDVAAIQAAMQLEETAYNL